jgi:hypothetical protein
MNETLTVVNQPHSLISVSKENSTSAPIAKLGAAHIDTIDIIRTYMVPAKDISKDIAALTNRGLYVDSTITYKDARRPERYWPEQTLIVWSSSHMPLKSNIGR